MLADKNKMITFALNSKTIKFNDYVLDTGISFKTGRCPLARN